jgi:hypothetical protein
MSSPRQRSGARETCQLGEDVFTQPLRAPPLRSCMVSARHPLLRALEPVAESLGAELVGPRHVRAGDVPLEWEGVVVGGLRLPGMQGSLERMMAAVEHELGAAFAHMSREQKQLAVRMLDDRGAFALRRSVESVADAMGVSRFTIYNYLNAAG